MRIVAEDGTVVTQVLFDEVIRMSNSERADMAKLVKRSRELEASAKAVTRAMQDSLTQAINTVRENLDKARAEEKSIDLGNSHPLKIKWRHRRKAFQEVLRLLEGESASDRITARELRAVGIEVADDIPDWAWIRREAFRPHDCELHYQEGVDVGVVKGVVLFDIMEPFQWEPYRKGTG